MDDPDRADQVRHVRWNGGKDTGFDFPQHTRLGQDAHARLERDGMFDGFDVVELHRNVDVHSTLTERLVYCLADAQASIKGDEVFAFQISMGNLPPPGKRMRPVTYEDHRFGVPRHN